MTILKMYRCKECRHEFRDLLPEAQLFEVGDVHPVTGALINKKPVPQACPECEGNEIEPILKNGKHLDA